MEIVTATCSPTDTPLTNASTGEATQAADMMQSGLTGILSAFQSLKKPGAEFVLATIVETQGSTYRKAGARMLITQSGSYCGLLGGGCFESDLIEHANKVFTSRTPRELYYDMRSPEDLVWGLGLGCNGAVRIWLEHVSADNDYEPMQILETALATESPSVLITTLIIDMTGSAHHYLFGDSDKVPVEHNPPDEFVEQATITLKTGGAALATIRTGTGDVTAFFNRLTPPVHLLIIGGGPDALPVTLQARLLGWHVSVVDYRENYSNQENFPSAHRVICATPEQLVDKVDLSKIDAVVLMTHKYEYDLRYLQHLTHSSLRYIGLLGPTARRNELLRAAGAGIQKELSGRVYGPVGLDIGGEMPEEITLALLAEIQMVLNRRKGGHLAAAGPLTPDKSKTDRLGCIVLAAGGSTRFGALKQLLEFKGRSLLNRIVRLACELTEDRVIVVHGPKPNKCQCDIAAYKVKNLINEDWQDGMAGSLTLAMGAVPAEYDAVLILLCDQAMIERAQLDRLVEAWTLDPNKIIASSYANTTGVPVIIPRAYFGYFHLLSGDQGARQILTDLATNVISVEMPEAELDIDTQEDFARLLFHNSKRD